MQTLVTADHWVGASLDKLCAGRYTLIGATEIRFETQSDYQQIAIVDVPELGLGLFLDGNVQLIATGEQVYHERIALLPVLAHPNPRKVLILGGGDGCAAREVLRDPRVEQVTLVELDPAVIEACAEHLAPLNGGSLRDPRVAIHTEDARLFLQRTDLSDYAVVIIDFLDAYTSEDLALYNDVLSELAPRIGPETIVSLHGDVGNPPFWSALRLQALTAQHFAHVALHSAFVNCYASEWGFILASRSAPIAELVHGEILAQRAATLAASPETFVPALFPALFQPAPQLARLAKQLAAAPFDLPSDQEPETYWLT